MDATVNQSSERGQQEALVARLIAELQFDDGAFEQSGFAPTQPTRQPAVSAEETDWVKPVSERMAAWPTLETSTGTLPQRTLSTNPTLAMATTPTSNSATISSGVPVLDFDAIDPLIDHSTEPVSDDGWEYLGVNQFGKAEYLGPRPSLLSVAANFGLTIAGLGLGVSLLLNFQVILSLMVTIFSPFLTTVAPGLHL
jgi:hypothetical protein